METIWGQEHSVLHFPGSPTSTRAPKKKMASTSKIIQCLQIVIKFTADASKKHAIAVFSVFFCFVLSIGLVGFLGEKATIILSLCLYTVL